MASTSSGLNFVARILSRGSILVHLAPTHAVLSSLASLLATRVEEDCSRDVRRKTQRDRLGDGGAHSTRRPRCCRCTAGRPCPAPDGWGRGRAAHSTRPRRLCQSANTPPAEAERRSGNRRGDTDDIDGTVSGAPDL